MRATRLMMTAVIVTAAACGGKLPGGKGVPGGDKVPGGLPGGESGTLDPNSCGSYAGSEEGAKLKLYFEAVVDLQRQSQDMANGVAEGCKTMGKELGMADADLTGEPKELCAKVWNAYNENMKVAVKTKAAYKVKYKPAVCQVDVNAEAEVAAKCEGKASADVGASCSGVCHGKCDGKCEASGKAGAGGGAAGGECNGECSGSCHGSCEGHADVKASGECKAHAQTKASADVKCTEPEFSATLDAKLVVDKSKAEATLHAMEKGFPKLLVIAAKMKSMQAAVESTVKAGADLKNMGGKLTTSFKDQAMCVSGQIAASVNAAASIQANVSVSVEVSASASASAQGGA